MLPIIDESFRIQENSTNILPLRVLIVLAAGLGKTIVSGFWLQEELAKWPKQKVLFLCHENSILEQSEKEYERIFGSELSYKKFYGQNEKLLNETQDITFASFQSMRSFLQSLKEEEKKAYQNHFTILIVDESHHSQAETYKEVIEYFDVLKRFGMTATPDRSDLKDIRDIFGSEIINLPLETALTEGLLTPVDYHVMTDQLDKAMLRELMRGVENEDQKISLKQLNETLFINKRDEEIAREIERFSNNGEKKTVIFCERIEHIKMFLPFLPETITAPFHSERTNQENKESLADFRSGKIRYILSVNKFNEGIDIPDAEVIVFLRSTDSENVFLQQLGRGLRLSPNKKKVIVLDFVANIQRLIDVRQLTIKISNHSDCNFKKEKIVIKGEKFIFSFDDDLIKDVYSMIEKIRQKLYISDIPSLLNEYSAKNILPADQVIAGTGKKLWWKCSDPKCGYEWAAVGCSRVRGIGCPACAHNIVTPKNNLTVTHPELAKEYSAKNILPADQVMAGTHRKFWWKCNKCNHEWAATGNSRAYSKVKGGNCPNRKKHK